MSPQLYNLTVGGQRALGIDTNVLSVDVDAALLDRDSGA